VSSLGGAQASPRNAPAEIQTARLDADFRGENTPLPPTSRSASISNHLVDLENGFDARELRNVPEDFRSMHLSSILEILQRAER